MAVPVLKIIGVILFIPTNCLSLPDPSFEQSRTTGSVRPP
ncbi:hypothetical protein CCACVL1_23399 [Corchorus capsularis]|uniref:Uncharacterized protein n=1 Tax=Corchorus capsularis TaxID=210143 RepID=A0A1R3GU05_COCAP|nr:hypothetical protein CCACVL1_23399 [Corchorus capsularis]